MTSWNFSQSQLMGLDTGHLIELYPNHYVHKQAAKAVIELQSVAKSAGIDLRLASSFRSFQRQSIIWNEKASGGRVVYNRSAQPLELSTYSALDAIHAICIYSAIPGLSRHHWGCDFDVYDANQFDANNRPQLLASEYAENGPNFKLYTWLIEQSKNFGFTHVYKENKTVGVAAEPWHISYIPVARQAQNSFRMQDCQNILSEHCLAFKQTLLDNLPSLYQTYVEAYYV
ncbi:peptidase M15B and M15C, D,D-carboxypeptidase VanY/endolysin [Catenovulum agarivorans DS-2]|uniref:Peptidase M15B and M15C, D,D-carboxypeptidase VanY/endolysin n=1 Tax=Catenovulum agarivorans DS-2 TaxID=1328313 RepID=W7QTL8_9ALTE|nr:M15 family metallopeptidase [Catenovulum agarivorans]EWH12372.1 peptidase M15B and M15C, D,D-carboxypeptidase VanY/endolysin [Catenovulum agarivorans DS-2]